jgi:hypothetical protein
MSHELEGEPDKTLILGDDTQPEPLAASLALCVGCAKRLAHIIGEEQRSELFR